MSVLSRAALEGSPLADLHAIASELGIDGFRRLRKADLVAAILAQSGASDGAEAPDATDAPAEEETPRRRRAPRGGRARRADADADADAGPEAEADAPGAAEPAERGGEERSEEREERPARRRGGRGRRGDRDAEPTDDREAEQAAEGVVELSGNGAGFLRLTAGATSDDDVYVSAAQVRRCELVDGDRVTGPVRRPRRSERYPSLVRVDTINGKPADEIAAPTPFDDLPAVWPTERLALGAEDPTLKAIEWLTPVGRGSRATIVGAPRAGKSEVLRRLAAALHGQDGLELSVVLLGVRPEEAHAWRTDGPLEPVAALTFAASADAQAQALERAVDTARRQAARGAHVVLLVDALDAVGPAAARRALAAARAIADGGSLTIVAASTLPVGGETTVVALDAALTAARRFPALDLPSSGTLRAELLVGDAGAEEIAKAHAQALGEG